MKIEADTEVQEGDRNNEQSRKRNSIKRLL